MKTTVTFYSYFKDLTNTDSVTIELPEGSSIGDLLSEVYRQFPKMKSMERSTLIAVGLEYQDASYTLLTGDEVSLFPPVQGGAF